MAKLTFTRLLGIQLLVLTAAIVMGWYDDHPSKHFGEGRVVTYFSALQLLVIAWICQKIFKVRNGLWSGPVLRAPHLLWLLIAAGFVFLALDESLQIHEGLDKWFHRVTGLEETPFTDRLDDVLVLSYGVIGLGILLLYRRELLRFQAMLPLLLAGFALMVLMVGVDMLTNRKEFIQRIAAADTDPELLASWFAVVEDAIKVFAEGCLLLGFRNAGLIAADLGAAEPSVERPEPAGDLAAVAPARRTTDGGTSYPR